MVLPMMLGIHMGGMLFKVIPEKRLRSAIISLLMLLSLTGLVRAAIGHF